MSSRETQHRGNEFVTRLEYNYTLQHELAPIIAHLDNSGSKDQVDVLEFLTEAHCEQATQNQEEAKHGDDRGLGAGLANAVQIQVGYRDPGSAYAPTQTLVEVYVVWTPLNVPGDVEIVEPELIWRGL